VVTFTGPTRHLEGWSALSKGRRFLVENVREALHRPGEWYLDRKTGDLIYSPCRRRSAAHGNGRAAHRHARADSGRAGQRQLCPPPRPARPDIRPRQLEHAAEGNNFSQAEVNLGGAISLSGARDCVIEKCIVRNVGTYAIDFGATCQNNRLEGCTLSDLGAGGVKSASLASSKTPTSSLSSDHQQQYHRPRRPPAPGRDWHMDRPFAAQHRRA